MTPGRYSLVLHFAARHSKPGEPASEESNSTTHVSNIFNVFCNGQTLLENFDLGREAGKTDVVTTLLRVWSQMHRESCC